MFEKIRKKIENNRESKNLFWKSAVLFKDKLSGLLEYFKTFEVFLQPPTMVGVELTNFCNLRCAMCPYESMIRKKEAMSLALFKKICDESRIYKIPLTWFSFFGDPLMYPYLKEALQYFKKNGFGMGGVSTNGLLLNSENIKTLVENCKLVIIALDSVNEEAYKKIRNNNQFKNVCNNIRELILKSKNSDLKIEIQLLRTKFNKDERVESFEKLFGKHSNVDYFIKDCGIYAPGGPDITAKPDSWGMKDCRQPYSILNILSNGNCVFCCRDLNGEQIIGNINKDSLYDVWYGPRARLMRAQFRKGRENCLSVCKRCNKEASLLN